MEESELRPIAATKVSSPLKALDVHQRVFEKSDSSNCTVGSQVTTLPPSTNEGATVGITLPNAFGPFPELFVCEPPLACAVCELTGGPMLRLRREGGQREWVHVSCGTWLPQALVDLVERRVTLRRSGKRGEEPAFGRESCAFCRKKTGLLCRCHEADCDKAFHPECARRLSCELALPYQLHPKQAAHVAFCHLHSKSYTFRKRESNLTFERNRCKAMQKLFREFQEGFGREEPRPNKFERRVKKAPGLVVRLRKLDAGFELLGLRLT